jgi:ATP-binding cassette subfamily C protein LapB
MSRPSSKDHSAPLKNDETKEREPSRTSERISLDKEWLKEICQQKAFDDDSLLTCLEILAAFHGRPTSSVSLKAGLPLEKNLLTPELFIRAAERVGLAAKIIHKKLEDISPLTLPCVLLLEGAKACLLVSQPSPAEVEIILPETERGSRILQLEDLNQLYSGYAIFCQPLYRYDQRSSDIEIERPKSWFWGTLAKSWSIYAQVAVAAILVNLFSIVSPLFVMNVYDRVIPNNATETLWVLATGVFIAFGFDLLLKVLRVHYVDSAGRNADIILASRIYEHILNMRLASRPQSAGSFANQLREFETLREFFSSATLVALVDLPFVFFFIVLIGYIGGIVAWVPLLSIPLIILVTLILQGPLRGWINKSFKEGAQKHALLVETINGLETIKSFGAQSRMQRHWESFVSQAASSSNNVRFLAALASNFAGFIQQLSYILVVVVGVYLIAAGELSTGALIACSILTGRATAPLGQVVSLLSRLNQSRASLEALNKIIKLPSEIGESQSYLHRPNLQGSIDFKNVSFSYPEQKTKALEDLTLSIKAGEKIGLVGRIGSGKTTLEKLILNLYSPEEGTVRIDDTDIRQINPADLRQNIGYVPQDIYLFYGSVRDNITFGADHVTDEEVLKAAILSGVHDFVRHHPMGYDMRVNEGGGSLSGGQRQAIALARAFVRNPSILLLDEPTAMMDSASEAQMIQKLRSSLLDRTVIIISHRLPLLELVSRIVVIDKGRVIADGPRAEVLNALSNSQIRSAG